MRNRSNSKKNSFLFRNIFLCIIIGIISGVLCSFFVQSLNWITQIRISDQRWIFGLPIVGFLIPFMYKAVDHSYKNGVNLLLEEVHQPEKWVSWKLTPIVYISTLLSHLVGGSAGREGTALQISTSSADQLNRWFKLSSSERRMFLIAGLCGGFSASIGVPWAGSFFGIEVSFKLKSLLRQPIQLLYCFTASFIAWTISVGMNTPHFSFSAITPPDFSSHLLFYILGLSILIGLISRFYTEGLRGLESLMHFIPSSFRTPLGGFILLLLFLSFPLSSHQGLGVDIIQKSMTEAPHYTVPILKLLLTVLTLATGFKGGEFTPLVYIGTTLASWLSSLWQQPITFFAALGFVSLFGAASKTPLTCSILTCEIFGWQIAPYAFIVNYAAYATAGPHGIYKERKKDFYLKSI